MFTPFPSKRAYNPGGLASFQFAHHASVGAFPFVDGGKAINPVVLLAGHDWLVGYSTMYTLRFAEQAETSAHGVRYLQRITGFMPNDHADVIETMQTMENQYFVVVAMDANRRKRLVGGYGYPLLFTSSFDSGADRADGKGFTFEFTGYAPTRAPEYVG